MQALKKGMLNFIRNFTLNEKLELLLEAEYRSGCDDLQSQLIKAEVLSLMNLIEGVFPRGAGERLGKKKGTRIIQRYC